MSRGAALDTHATPDADAGATLFAERRGADADASAGASRDAGAGARTVVLLHGWAMNLRVFDALAMSLAREFTVLALDLPGHGRSPEAESLVREGWTLERLAAQVAPHVPPGALVLGWSLGGQVALQLARQAPERVGALALVSTTPRFVSGDGWPHGVAPTELAHFAQHLGSDYRDTVRDFLDLQVRDFLDLQVRGSRGAAAALATLQTALFTQGEASAAVLLRALEVLRTADLRAALPAIDVPTLVIGGQYDQVTPPGAARALAAALPRALYHEFTRCGHAPFLTHEAEFTTLLRDFALESAPGPQAQASTPGADRA